MKSLLSLIAMLYLMPVCNIQAQETSDPNSPVTIGNLEGDEVIVHVYRKKEDQFPFIEFSVVVDESTGQQIVEITQVEGKTTTGGFMIITGVSRAEDIGVIRSDRYEISFRKVKDYKIYEKAVMDYLRRLPVPVIEEEVVIEVPDEPIYRTDDVIPLDVNFPEFDDEEEVVDLGEIGLDPWSDIENTETEENLSDEFILDDLEPLNVLTLADTTAIVVHVHRDENDIDPFKEFVVTPYRDEIGRKKAKVVEVTGVKSGTRFIIMTGFEDKGEEGILQSFEYDVSAYNLDDYFVEEQAVVEFMKGLTSTQFDGTEATIKDGWEKALEEKKEVVPEPVEEVVYTGRRRQNKKKEMSQREINKIAKEVQKATLHPPKHKSKYGKYKSGKMSSRMARYNKKKTQCPSIRGH